MAHLVNGLPIAGSSWTFRRSPRIVGTVLTVEAPMLKGQLHQVTVHCESDQPEGVTISIDVGTFLRDWRDLSEPEGERPTKWELLMADDDL
jgi:hypothetical protein